MLVLCMAENMLHHASAMTVLCPLCSGEAPEQLVAKLHILSLNERVLGPAVVVG
eukprot:CAMPEP_0174740424 /NCGR_PEP_ID=MMETSP1094-20130205/73551_1 /TAXON_ID=156173 /ORGANISM="Chrysochromulina brevifilum, Strain UTEX LB 985" /LENGTH=53 /DNA_ID=CAMNT_0015944129 /DNA_START=50 /DNA_END=207 /DNA_ORIENTATION=+